VGTGALLLHAAGLTRGRLVTCQGAAAAADMAMWLVGRIHGRDHARAVRRHIQEQPVPQRLAPRYEGVPGRRAR
jgi:transcriptional regulator GlxA family with amidase domain